MWPIDWKSQRGGVLIQGLIIITFLVLFGITLSTLVSVETQSHIRDASARQAYYLAVSGLEYGIKRFLQEGWESPRDWQENLVWPDSQNTHIQLELFGGGRLRLTSRGTAHGFSRTMILEARFVDFSRYAVVAGGEVEGVKVLSLAKASRKPGAYILEKAPVLPRFDPAYFKEQGRRKDFLGPETEYRVVNDLRLRRPVRAGKVFAYVEGDVVISADFLKLSRAHLYRNWWGIYAPREASVVISSTKEKGNRQIRLPGMLIMAGNVTLLWGKDRELEEDSEQDDERGEHSREHGEGHDQKKKRKPGGVLVVYYHPQRVREFLKNSLNESPLVVYDIQKWVLH